MAEIFQDEENQELSEQQRRELITNYFYARKVKFPSWTNGRILLAYLGVFLGFLFMLYLKNSVVTLILSLAAFIFAFWHFYNWIMPWFKVRKFIQTKPTDEQMIAWLIKDLKEVVKPRSIEMLSLNYSDIKPENFIIIPVPIFWQTPGINPEMILREPCSDGFIYTTYRVQIIVLTQHYISLYKCNYNWLENNIISQSTNEFYFQDITSIRNDVQNLDFMNIDDETQPIGVGKVFHLSNVSGENMIVISDIPSLQSMGVISVKLDYLVSLIRMILRNRRFGIERELSPEQIAEQQKSENDVIQENKDERDFNIQTRGALYSEFDPNRKSNTYTGNRSQIKSKKDKPSSYYQEYDEEEIDLEEDLEEDDNALDFNAGDDSNDDGSDDE